MNKRLTTRVFPMVFAAAFSLFHISGYAQNDSADITIGKEDLEHILRIKKRSVQHLALNPVIVRAIRTQNRQQLSLDEIKSRDEAWTSTDGLTTLKRELQNNLPGAFLRKTIQENAAFTEAFATDAQGANVAAYPVTSDYWQGDEEKWSAAFNNGQGKIFSGPIELDQSTQSYQVQISAPVLDRGVTIGVLVVGVDLSYIKQGS